MKFSLPTDLQEFFQKQMAEVKVRGVGLFLGKESVDLVELRRTVKGARLVHYVSVPLTLTEGPQESLEEPAREAPKNASTPDQLLGAIRRAIREAKFRGQKVTSALPEEDVILRYFQMPRLPRKEWSQAIRFEARKYIPFNLEELISDFTVLPDKKEKGKMNVVFIAAKKEAVDRHLALLAKASLQVGHLEALPFSFMRLLYTVDPSLKKERSVGVVDVDGSSCSIFLMKEGLPYLVRRVTIDFSQEHAVEKLLDEVRLTLRYYRNQFPSETVSRILLFGNRLTPDLSEFFTRELSLPTKMENLSKAFGEEKIPLGLARTLGIGLRGLSAGFEIELLPRKEVVSSQQTQLVKMSLLSVGGAVAVLIALFLILSNLVGIQKRALKRREGSVDSRVTSLSKEDLQKKNDKLGKKVALYRNLYERRMVWTKKLSRLGKILPQGAWITNMTIEDRSDEEVLDNMVYRVVLKGVVYTSNKNEELKIPTQFLTAIQQDADFFEGLDEAKLISMKRDVFEDVEVTTFEMALTGKKPASQKKTKTTKTESLEKLDMKEEMARTKEKHG